MEIRFEPYNLQINDTNSVMCPCCNSILQKEIRKGNYLINGECRYCRYSERSFVTYSSSWQKNYPDGCTCEYSEKNYLYIICENCKSPKCLKCKNQLNCCNKNCGSVICSKCVEKMEFNNIWKITTPQEKLHLYGYEKLKILAKNKKIKGYSKYKKDELINVLSSLVNENDFPIKSAF
jgi:hypothetical protein